MSNNVLKKQFSEKDIQRVRNLVKGKSGERITHGIGYSKDVEDHVEGDIWEENHRKWTIKDGIKQNITKMDKFKKTSVPLFCPSCKHVMDKQLDPFYFKSYGSCLFLEALLSLSNYEKCGDGVEIPMPQPKKEEKEDLLSQIRNL